MEHDRRPASLSGGQRQRVAGGPGHRRRAGLVLADEPTATDSHTGSALLDTMEA
ncbi:MAG: hypothetical protein R3F43_02725 [bacterium]